jgi:hypothetical protein
MHSIEELATFAANYQEGSLPASAKKSCAHLITDLLGPVAAGLHSDLAVAARKRTRW